MKKLLNYFLLLGVTILLVACSSKDEENVPTNNDVLKTFTVLKSLNQEAIMADCEAVITPGEISLTLDTYDALKSLIENGEKYDEVITIGPLIMMKFVCKLTAEYNVKTVASMNPIMIDGTGMCGGCRLTVGGKTVFACVDGPEFDGHQIDFDEAMKRSSMYREFERKAHEDTCNLFKKGEK